MLRLVSDIFNAISGVRNFEMYIDGTLVYIGSMKKGSCTPKEGLEGAHVILFSDNESVVARCTKSEMHYCGEDDQAVAYIDEGTLIKNSDYTVCHNEYKGGFNRTGVSNNLGYYTGVPIDLNKRPTTSMKNK